jgi:succinate dehydrogenase / fumarate reductase iron-sulfur subunit
MGSLYLNMERMGQRPVVPLAEEPAEEDIEPVKSEEGDIIRLSDCIECGMCISACPVATTTSSYFGPAPLAGARQVSINGNKEVLSLVDSAKGVWRCHSAYECSEVCPSFVEPGKKIMQLRRVVVRSRIRSLFGSKN